jgi:uncharacterized RDD family membrane protein YckC
MRCPKCGYNSFDHLDTCKKCGRDLVEFKQKFGIKSMLFSGKVSGSEDLAEAILDEAVVAAAVAAPDAAKEAVAATVAGDATVHDSPAAPAGDNDDFGFDFMGDSGEDDDLSFDELFEEAAEEEDVEETLEGPEAEAEVEKSSEFELPEVDDELEDDFGFDTEDSGTDGSGGRKDPFDLPESSQDARAPESMDKTVQHNSETAPIADSDEVAPTASRFPSADALLADLSMDDVTEAPSQELSLPESDESTDSSAVVADEEPELSDKADVEELAAEAVALEDAAPAQMLAESAVAEESEDDWELLLNPGEIPPVGRRALAFVFDLTLLLLISVAFIAAAEAVTASESVRLIPSFETFVALSIPYFLMIFVLSFGYFTLFHFLTGQTPGKMLTALRVESLEREPLTLGQAFLRSVGGLIQLVPAGLGFLSVLLYSQQRGLSDRLAGTLVVSLSAAPDCE